MVTQITRALKKIDSQILKKHSDGSTLPYSVPDLTTILSGAINPIFVLQLVDANDNPYPIHITS